MVKKLNIVTIGLLLILGLRVVAHIEPALSLQFAGLLSLLLYGIPLVGVIQRKRWGPIMSGVVGLLDLVMTLFYFRGSGLFTAAIADGALIVLSYLDHKQIATKVSPADTVHSSPEN
ncbi:MAG TPA: hypothetical protein PLR20_12550 [Syntrophales bacterium]|nr:hypothetical protein [Syntrophales bacterium]HOX95546.1 hypothetical protein [Syntrophales bacterium]HPI58411.1 hypothetical protein [Syntrophales bacterium]HPN23756.1 hypothetical protein [Syntrophales bacterium]HQM30173.1 hypothetical protein [Syntrophales bacterium]